MSRGAMESTALKAAKKMVKKNGSYLFKCKSLVKKILKKIGEESSPEEIQKWLAKSAHFSVHVDGKMITFNENASLVDDPTFNAAASSKKSPSVVTSSANTTVRFAQMIEWRQENKIVLKGTSSNATDDEAVSDSALNQYETYYPYTSFEALKQNSEVPDILLRQCTEINGFRRPSPIQAQCWPVLLHTGVDGKQRDVIGIAETGSGKTLAFGIPALMALTKHRNTGKKVPRMLVLAPTRELAIQSEKVLNEFGALLSLTTIVVYGGVSKTDQKDALRKGVDCIVATPGRLKDLINEKSCDLKHVSQLVLDEADRMLDMGFEEDVRYIISKCLPTSQGRQTCMFSATWPASIQKIAMEYMTNPVRIYVGFEAIVGSNGENDVDDSLSANKRVAQNVEVIEDRAREPRLRQILKTHFNKADPSKSKILIFALYKKEAARLETFLQRDGWADLVTSIHGDKSQDARNKSLEAFKSGTCPLMVATDVAARGLDIPNVELVINYTFPLTIEDYVHRIGRTGRAGKTGISYTFFQPSDKSHAGELQQVMKQAGQTVPEDLMKFGSTIKKKEHKMYGNFGPTSTLPMKKAVKITFDSDGEE